MERPFKKILIVGAGPSGLLLALLLSKHGIPVHIVEKEDHLDQSPRAAHYGPPAIPEFFRAGILDEVRRRGVPIDTLSWRRFDDFSRITGFDGGVLEDVDGVDLRTACLAMQDLDKLMLDLVLENYHGTISWKHTVVDVGHNDQCAWVDVETSDGRKRMEADYVVGCDGANSQVRKSLFGNEFPGFTWDAQIIATNTYYDFDKFGFDDVNLIIHPEHHYIATRLNNEGLYRLTYGDKPGLSLEEYKERQPWKFAVMLPGHPTPSDYKLVSLAPYRMHQRCAPSFRVGRVLLVADAAHLCNPWGGLGITGGFVDVGGLYDCLSGIWDGLVSDPNEILDLYSSKRIEKWRSIIDVVSRENFQRVCDADPPTRLERDDFMQLCKQLEGDITSMKNMLVAQMAVRYDFTQHYVNKEVH